MNEITHGNPRKVFNACNTAPKSCHLDKPQYEIVCAKQVKTVAIPTAHCVCLIGREIDIKVHCVCLATEASEVKNCVCTHENFESGHVQILVEK